MEWRVLAEKVRTRGISNLVLDVSNLACIFMEGVISCTNKSPVSVLAKNKTRVHINKNNNDIQ